MYNTITQFYRDYCRAYSNTSANTNKLGADEYADFGRCWNVYRNAYNADLGMLAMGRLENLDDKELANFLATSDASRGSVLRMEHWSIRVNDSWILGGIHAHHPFYVASDATTKNFVNLKHNPGTDAAERIFTVTARELIGIQYFGYTIRQGNHEALGTVYECTAPVAADRATLPAYRQHVAGVAAAVEAETA